MTAFLCGMLGALFAGLLVGLGVWIGSRRRPKTPAQPPKPTPAQEQEAFRTLMHYSPEIAYGDAPAEEE